MSLSGSTLTFMAFSSSGTRGAPGSDRSRRSRCDAGQGPRSLASTSRRVPPRRGSNGPSRRARCGAGGGAAPCAGSSPRSTLGLASAPTASARSVARCDASSWCAMVTIAPGAYLTVRERVRALPGRYYDGSRPGLPADVRRRREGGRRRGAHADARRGRAAGASCQPPQASAPAALLGASPTERRISLASVVRPWRLQFVGPAASAMEHAQHDHRLNTLIDRVGDDVGRTGDDQLTRLGNAPRASQARVVGELGDAVADGYVYAQRRPRGAGEQVVEGLVEILLGPIKPEDLHHRPGPGCELPGAA